MYSAVSIITALKDNRRLGLEGIEDVKCPVSKDDCQGIPFTCKKGIDQKCKRPVIIFHDYKKLTILTFKFMVSSKNNSGFIPKGDSSLERMIKHNFIKKNILELVG